MSGLSGRMWAVLRTAGGPVPTPELVAMCGRGPNPRQNVWSVLVWWEETERVERGEKRIGGKRYATWRIKRW